MKLEAADHRGRTALHYAAMQGSLPVLQSLLQAEASVHAHDNFAATSLYTAVKQKFTAAAQLLLAWKVCVRSARGNPVDGSLIDESINQISSFNRS